MSYVMVYAPDQEGLDNLLDFLTPRYSNVAVSKSVWETANVMETLQQPQNKDGRSFGVEIPLGEEDSSEKSDEGQDTTTYKFDIPVDETAGNIFSTPKPEIFNKFPVKVYQPTTSSLANSEFEYSNAYSLDQFRSKASLNSANLNQNLSLACRPSTSSGSGFTTVVPPDGMVLQTGIQPLQITVLNIDGNPLVPSSSVPIGRKMKNAKVPDQKKTKPKKALIKLKPTKSTKPAAELDPTPPTKRKRGRPRKSEQRPPVVELTPPRTLEKKRRRRKSEQPVEEKEPSPERGSRSPISHCIDSVIKSCKWSTSPFPYGKQKQPKVKVDQCQICMKFLVVPDIRTKIIHAGIHFTARRYQCNLCSVSHDTCFLMKRHIKLLHPEMQGAGKGVGFSYIAPSSVQDFDIERLVRICFPQELKLDEPLFPKQQNSSSSEIIL